MHGRDARGRASVIPDLRMPVVNPPRRHRRGAGLVRISGAFHEVLRMRQATNHRFGSRRNHLEPDRAVADRACERLQLRFRTSRFQLLDDDPHLVIDPTGFPAPLTPLSPTSEEAASAGSACRRCWMMISRSHRLPPGSLPNRDKATCRATFECSISPSETPYETAWSSYSSGLARPAPMGFPD